ncbi:hypothetical protein PHYSODRAFT_305714 [Phytophthora sojae]|uniref:Uncharacterized protein n=1 Tax=Phytophthora sojae (strain P6497) TaxID=1094619 RepID=G5A684_PHYSP|nr:hypothetical protein PHYSODRAFT_305714 [Phytophthora sojae]EGZ08839.1 hypothetical protein PHYSODRAFT_305714 [Phytophthora sojae]|eukprot:XP_009535472.1 hypothetical protein PHYSODRAFT_305714 [Phytophthora sojae]
MSIDCWSRITGEALFSDTSKLAKLVIQERKSTTPRSSSSPLRPFGGFSGTSFRRRRRQHHNGVQTEGLKADGEVKEKQGLSSQFRNATRFLRADAKVAMDFTGFIQDSQEAKQLPQRWLTNGESVTKVASKLKVPNLPQEAAVRHVNLNYLGKYMGVCVTEPPTFLV